MKWRVLSLADAVGVLVWAALVVVAAVIWP